MAQQYGLGRGLASLIPPKKAEPQEEGRTHTPVAGGNFMF